jgi:hypothetical protein
MKIKMTDELRALGRSPKKFRLSVEFQKEFIVEAQTMEEAEKKVRSKLPKMKGWIRAIPFVEGLFIVKQ